jgi:sensor histidine kinase YesM
MNSPLLAQIFAIMGFTVIFVAFLVISKTLGSIGILLLRLEYLLGREFELVLEKEKIKQKILQMQAKEEEKQKQREEALDPLMKIPYAVKKND